MNLPTYTTDTLYLDQCHAEGVLHGIVHTLLFHRMIYRSVRPKEMPFHAYDTLYYVMIDDDRLHHVVAEKVATVLESLRERPAGTLSVVFYRVQSKGGWFSKERADMERWIIPLLSSAPVPLYQVVNEYLPFDIVDMDKPSGLKDILQFIVSGPPKMGGLFS